MCRYRWKIYYRIERMSMLNYNAGNLCVFAGPKKVKYSDALNNNNEGVLFIHNVEIILS